MPDPRTREEEVVERIVAVLKERQTWLPSNPYGVAALILNALNWPVASAHLDQAMKWALIKFVVDLQQRDAEDAVAACEENGWRQRSTHDLYDDVIDTVSRLATGSLDPVGYLEEERRLAP